ncbi:hypothetical protein B2J93_8421 [Marssonina coronariae]|uniref:S-adenosylmethionine-dependent methyltransferase-like protein n=1 Tax=Diplocarpon coronariae TaxID=2795749 RepID=A0A218YZE2_9HELO|nr:hypothetical protein B2J93_8421 [Marssonina coronariae]
MPFGFKHSNRSKQGLLEPAVSAEGIGSSLATPTSAADESDLALREAFDGQQSPLQLQLQSPSPSPSPSQSPSQEAQPYTAYSVAPDLDDLRRQHRTADFPTKSPSTRYHPSGGGQSPNSSARTDELALDSQRQQHQQQQQQQQQYRAAQLPPVYRHKKSKSLFDRMRPSKHSESKNPPAISTHDNSTGLARRPSNRQVAPLLGTTLQDSRLYLPSPLEGNEDDGGLNSYLPGEAQAHSLLEGDRQHSIRPAQADSESPNDPPGEEQQLYDYPKPESGAQSYYHSQDRAHKPKVNVLPTSLTIGDYRQQAPETTSLLSYESPRDSREENPRPVSVQSNEPSPASDQQQHQDQPTRTASAPQGPRPSSQYSMAPSGGSSGNRRAGDPKQTTQGAPGGQPESRDGAPPNHSRGQFSGNQPHTAGMGPVPSSSVSGPGYRGGLPQREYSGTGGGEQGRSTPPPAGGDRDLPELYKDLMNKYKKVKGLYFEKTSQVEQLQNTLANQRLSQSRTSLDDSEYMTRFQRLDGAAINLAFNIRKDWRAVPSWLAQSVNQDATKTGKQEMIAVGRACITKFLVDGIFHRTLHPGLEPGLGLRLKNVEQNIRRFSPALNSQEESEALTAKIVQWRLATFEGLRDVLGSPESEERRNEFSRNATKELTESLRSFLHDPCPPGIWESAHMIVDIAVGIASNLSLESRDISICYPMPGDMVQPSIMKIEGQVPVLDNPGSETADNDSVSMGSGDRDDKEDKPESKSRKEKTKSGILSAMMGGSSGPSSKKSSLGAAVPETSSEGKKLPGEDGSPRVRFAGFVAVEVRGRQVLHKAPIWTVS